MTDTRSGRGLLAARSSGSSPPSSSGRSPTPRSRRRSTTTARGHRDDDRLPRPVHRAAGDDVGVDAAHGPDDVHAGARAGCRCSPPSTSPPSALSLAVLAVGLVMAAAATASAGWSHDGAASPGWLGDVRSAVIIVVLQVTMAAAFGALAAQTRRRPRRLLLAPTLWAIAADALFGAAAVVRHLRRLRPAVVGPSRSTTSAQTLTAVAVVGRRAGAIGLARSLRREVK